MIVLRRQKQFGLFNFMGNFAKASKAKGLSTTWQQTAKAAGEKAALAKDMNAAGLVDASEITKFTEQANKATQNANKMSQIATWEKTKGVAKVGTLGAAGLAGVGAVGTGMAMNNALSGNMGQDGY